MQTPKSRWFLRVLQNPEPTHPILWGYYVPHISGSIRRSHFFGPKKSLHGLHWFTLVYIRLPPDVRYWRFRNSWNFILLHYHDFLCRTHQAAPRQWKMRSLKRRDLWIFMWVPCASVWFGCWSSPEFERHTLPVIAVVRSVVASGKGHDMMCWVEWPT